MRVQALTNMSMPKHPVNICKVQLDQHLNGKDPIGSRLNAANVISNQKI